MSLTIIQQRLMAYNCQTSQAEENALKEITQEVVLMALSRAGFFRIAEFHGGTALRILYGLPRFSEDLDFVLLHQDKSFIWNDYFSIVNNELKAYGYNVECQDRSQANKNVKSAFLKDNSIGTVLSFNYPNLLHKKKIKIKLEVDINPPRGSMSEIKYLDFPLSFSIRLQDLPSSFAGKIHALLCRKYIKGRDWYDFIWYISRQVTVNYVLLQNAIQQVGPWQGKKVKVDRDWVKRELTNKINQLNWREVANDVRRFLSPSEQKSLQIWSKDYFIMQLEKFGN